MIKLSSRYFSYSTILAVLLSFYYLLPHSLSIFFEILFLIIVIFSNKRYTKINTLPIIWYLAFAFLLVATNIFRIDLEKDVSVNYLRTTVNCLLFVIISCYAIKDKKDIDKFITIYGLCGLLICLILLPSIINLISYGGGRLGQTVTVKEDNFISNPINLGYILLLINFCQFYCFLTTKDKIARLLFLLLLVSSFICILMTGTRKTLLGALIVYMTYLYCQNSFRKGKLFIYIIYALGLLALLYNLIVHVDFLYNGIGSRVEGVFAYFSHDTSFNIDDSAIVRDVLIEKSRNIFIDSPIIGAGITGAQKILSPITHPHNNYYTCLAFGGGLVFICYYWLYIKILLNYLMMKNKSKLDVSLLGLFFSFLLVDYTATTYNIIYFPSFLTIIYLNIIIHKQN